MAEASDTLAAAVNNATAELYSLSCTHLHHVVSVWIAELLTGRLLDYSRDHVTSRHVGELVCWKNKTGGF